MKKVLFVCYGSGHVKMVVPVARMLRERGLAQVQVLGLTTAAGVVREAGLPLLQVKDFVRPDDERALEHGRRLCAAMGQVADPEETAAYLGLSYAELEDSVGAEEAARLYARHGRQAFLPLRMLERIVAEVAPDLVFATNSPRAERAAIAAARTLGLPAVCLVDLFAVDEVRWIGQPAYADAVCVINEEVRRFLIAAGRRNEDIRVTGNPAFDALNEPAQVAAGAALRQAQGWEGRRVVLWPEQVEPEVHPFNGRPGDATLPDRVRDALLDWIALHPDTVLCVRPRAGDLPAPLPDSPQVRLTGQDWPLAPLLHAVDVVVTLTSTVGLEGHLAGARLVQVTGSVFDEAMPLGRFGVADEAVPVEGLPDALDRCTRMGRHPPGAGDASATARVVGVVTEFL